AGWGRVTGRTAGPRRRSPPVSAARSASGPASVSGGTGASFSVRSVLGGESRRTPVAVGSADSVDPAGSADSADAVDSAGAAGSAASAPSVPTSPTPAAAAPAPAAAAPAVDAVSADSPAAAPRSGPDARRRGSTRSEGTDGRVWPVPSSPAGPAPLTA